MIDKMTTLLDGQTCNGVKHKFGEELISKGVKFNKSNISNNLFPDKNPFVDESTYNVPEESNLLVILYLKAGQAMTS